jgi:16S rRNA (guanine527-N7)-methyltransferase
LTATVASPGAQPPEAGAEESPTGSQEAQLGAPPGAELVFGDRLPLAVKYAELLAGSGVRQGLIGPREASRIWDRHILNCAAVAPLVGPTQRVIDVGSGAGLPGLVLAIALPTVHVDVVEPLLRRSTWLATTVAELGLGNVTVRRARAEELAGEISAAVVVARAVAPLGRLGGWCLPLVAPGGRMLALKGESAAAELRRDWPQLRRLGARSAHVLTVGEGQGPPVTTVVEVIAGMGRGSTVGPTLRRPSSRRNENLTATPRRAGRAVGGR